VSAATTCAWLAFVAVVLAAIPLRPRHGRRVAPASQPSQRSRPAPLRSRLTGRVGWFVGFIASILLGGPFLLGATLACRALWPRWSAIRRGRRRDAALAAAYPDFVELFAIAIRAGCTPLQSLTATSGAVTEPVRSALREVLAQVRNGERMADAIAVLPVRLGPIAYPLAGGLALAERYGTPLTAVVERLADEAREQRRRNAEASARQLPVRLAFPLAGCTLPSFVLLTIVPLMAGTFSSLSGLRST
jgi:tight adherence protein C